MSRNYLDLESKMIVGTKVTIITVCLNAEKSIRRTIESVITQSYLDIEYIIIDGGSTDGTLEIIHEFDSVLTHVISEKDKGLYFAMNKGIALASGDLIGIINADDWYCKNAIEEIVSTLIHSPSADVIYGDVNYYLDKSFLYQKFADHNELNLNMIPHPGVFCRTDIFKISEGFNTKYQVAADYDFLLRAYIGNKTFEHTRTTLANYTSGGFSDRPKNIILSIFERNAIRQSYNLISKNKALILSTFEAMKTIYRRRSKMKMVFFLLASIASFQRKC